MLLFSFPKSCQTHCKFVSFRQIIYFFPQFFLFLSKLPNLLKFSSFSLKCASCPQRATRLMERPQKKFPKKLKVLIFAATDRFKNRWGETKSSMMDDHWPMMMISIFSKLWRGTAKLLELRPAWGGFCFAYILLHFPPKKPFFWVRERANSIFLFPFFFIFI